MKVYLITLMFFMAPAFAEPSYSVNVEDRFLATVDMTCGYTDSMVNEITNKYGEQPTTYATGVVADEEDPTVPVKMIIWTSEDESTWSMTVSPAGAENIMCYVITGNKIGPYPKQE